MISLEANELLSISLLLLRLMQALLRLMQALSCLITLITHRFHVKIRRATQVYVNYFLFLQQLFV